MTGAPATGCEEAGKWTDGLDATFDGKLLIGMSEAAKVLGVDPKTLRAYVALGQIRYVEVGFGIKRARRKFSKRHLVEFVERNSSGGEYFKF